MQILDPEGRKSKDIRASGLTLREYKIQRVKDYGNGNIINKPFASSGAQRAIQSGTLCPACLEILDSISDAERKYNLVQGSVHHSIALNYSYEQLVVSAHLGCHLCSILEASSLGYFRHDKPSLFPERYSEEDVWLHLEVRFAQQRENFCSANLGVVGPGESVSGIFGKLIDFVFVTGGHDSVPAPSPESYDNNSTGDEDSFRLIRQWLDDCLHNHVACRPIRDKPRGLPKRLLKLDDKHACIVENTSNPPYIALSHCWGPEAQIPEQILNGGSEKTLEICSLPRNFQDAIYATKKLGYDYLWIDSFCITQKSREDWLEQSAVMANIYAFSDFTIAALASAGPAGGCFRPRNPLCFQPLKAQNLIIQHRDKSHWWDLEINGAESRYPPLHTRAWVVQERVSAPRTVFYGSRGIYWECRTVRSSDGWTGEIGARDANIKMSLISILDFTEKSKDGDNDSIRGFQKSWKDLIQIYTRGNLTRYSDKLVALSGTTNETERNSHMKYIQGLWQHNLAEGLMWYLPPRFHWEEDFSSPDLSKRRIESGLPTWTWASTIDPVNYTVATGKVLWTAEVLAQNDQRHLRVSSWKRQVEIDWENEDNVRLVKRKGMSEDYTESHLLYRDEEAQPVGSEIFLLLIQRILIVEEPFAAAHRCLVIQYVADDQFRRVGICLWRFNSTRHDPFPAASISLGDEHVILI